MPSKTVESDHFQVKLDETNNPDVLSATVFRREDPGDDFERMVADEPVADIRPAHSIHHTKRLAKCILRDIEEQFNHGSYRPDQRLRQINDEDTLREQYEQFERRLTSTPEELYDRIKERLKTDVQHQREQSGDEFPSLHDLVHRVVQEDPSMANESVLNDLLDYTPVQDHRPPNDYITTCESLRSIQEATVRHKLTEDIHQELNNQTESTQGSHSGSNLAR